MLFGFAAATEESRHEGLLHLPRAAQERSNGCYYKAWQVSSGVPQQALVYKMNQPSLKESIGFTGTRYGMSSDQKDSLREMLERHRVGGLVWFHHGDCIGADTEASEIAQKLGYKIACHPPEDDSRRSFSVCDFCYPEKPYLIRNHEIVKCSAALIAAPHYMRAQRRSGTWATVRFAEQLGKPLYVLSRRVGVTA